MKRAVVVGSGALLGVISPDNCVTWWRLDSHPSGKWMIGKEYSNRLFVPIRRPGQRPPDKIERLLMTPNNVLHNAPAKP